MDGLGKDFYLRTPSLLINHVKINYAIKERRPGDIATCYADPTRAKKELDWVATKGIEDMCRDTWNYALKHKQ